MNSSEKEIKKWISHVDAGSLLHFLLYAVVGAVVFLAGRHADSMFLVFLSVILFLVGLCFILVHIQRIVISRKLVSITLLPVFVTRRYTAEQLDGMHIHYKSRKNGKIFFASIDRKKEKLFPLFKNRSLDNLLKIAVPAASLLSCRITGQIYPGTINPRDFAYDGPQPFRWRFDAPKITLVIFLMIAGFFSFAIPKMAGINLNDHKRVDTAEMLSQRMLPVVQKAQQIVNECDVISLKEQYLVEKIIIHLPVFSPCAKENSLWKTSGLDENTTTRPEDVKTVVLVESLDDNWGDASGTIVLLEAQKKFWFKVSSGVKKKQLTTSYEAYPYIVDYLETLKIK